MAPETRRINLTLDKEQAEKLSLLAKRSHMKEGTLARSLLSSALDGIEPDASRITEILDRIPGAWESMEVGREQVKRGETVPLSDL